VITNISGANSTPLQSSDASSKGVKVSSPAGPAASLPSESAQLTERVALANRVLAQPSVRLEEVERARALVASPNYPPRAIVEAVARLVAESNHALD